MGDTPMHALVKTSGPCQETSSVLIHFTFDTVILIEPGAYWFADIGWPANPPHPTPVIFLYLPPRSGITGMLCHTWLSASVMEIQAPIIILKCLNHLSRPSNIS